MDFIIVNEETRFGVRAFGIKEPLAGQKAEPAERSLIITPGLSFDMSGARLGYGGGYYDRFFTRTTRCARAGICFEKQLSWTALPREPHDALIDIIVTEDRVIFIGEVFHG